MEAGVLLTVVGSQGEADVICSLLRAHGIECGERATDRSAEQGGGWGGQREILVAQTDLASAQELLNRSSARSTPPFDG
jgi:type III secretory pathway lipoprotein EscJ